MSLLYSSAAPPAVCPIFLPDNINGTQVPSIMQSEDHRIEQLRRYAYGLALPAICCCGVAGNVLNLLVLTRKNMRGTAYIYMRGYSFAALLAILFAIPFALRVLVHKEVGHFDSLAQAFYSAHLELYLGNGCIGVGVMMLLALTLERYASVCHPGHSRPVLGPPRVTVALIPLATFLIYLPSVFRSEITSCQLQDSDILIYQRRDNTAFINSVFYSIYKAVLEIVFKVAPTLLLAGFNLRIAIVYRRTCERRRRMTSSRSACAEQGSRQEDHRKFAEERRLVLLLGSTSILFLVCVSPMVILHMTLSEEYLTMYPYQVFRALANLLELTNYSMTFYIYMSFSQDFRNTLLQTLHWPWLHCNRDCCNRGDRSHAICCGGKNREKNVEIDDPEGADKTEKDLGKVEVCIKSQKLTQTPPTTTTTQYDRRSPLV